MTTELANRDRDDPLAGYRDAFLLPEDTLYLNGNSLGPLPWRAVASAEQTLKQQWGEDLSGSWNKHGWIDLPFRCGELLAPLLGAGPGQVLCCDSISVNLFKLLAVCLNLRPERRVILSTADNFPTDLYAARGLESLLGEGRCRLSLVDEAALEQAINEEVAVLLLSHVNFRSAALLDVPALTRYAHSRGALVIWDLAHSAGVMPLALDAWDVDFAVGCGYKYLNGGPGAPAFIYAAKRHHQDSRQPLQGWMGHQAPFEFSPDYVPASGMGQFLTGTPPVLSMATLEGALQVFAELDTADLRTKSQGLGDLFQSLVAADPGLASVQLQSPPSSARRGAHLVYAHPEGYAISRALAARGVITDFRGPNLLRVGFSPLILRYVDVARAVDILSDVVANEDYRREEYSRRAKVT